jgi:hypothetical protein
MTPRPYTGWLANVTRDQMRDLDINQKDFGYLQHGAGTDGPFRTERVHVKHEHSGQWLAHFEGLWRRVHIQVNRTYIVYRGERITIQIDGA